MLSRREVLRAGTLSGLAIAAPGLLAACSGQGSSPRGATAGGVGLASSHVERHAVDPAAVGTGTSAVLALAGGLYGKLVGSDNLALSPFSVAVALGMTVNGAAGRTRDELLRVLAAPDAGTLDDGLNALTAYVGSLAGAARDTKSDEIMLDSATQVFGQAGYPWRRPFLDVLASSYGAGVREVDFEAATETAREAINRWTAGQTHDRIPEIVPRGAIDDSTRMVLVDALYFKAPWEQSFDSSATGDRPFHLGSGDAVAVPMMHGDAHYSEGDGWRAAHLLYSGGTLAMTVVLPDQGREQQLDTRVAGGGLTALLEPGSAKVDLTLPKWELLVPAALTGALTELGMRSAFDPEHADFSAMATVEQLYLHAVLQQVFIKVDEAGTEAAAATAVVVGATSAELDPPEPLVVDRPFVFVVHDVEHGTPLFLGKVLDPR